MKKLLLLLLCVPLIGIGQKTGCISGDCKNGYGTYDWSNGDKYIGEHKNGLGHGIGTYTYPSGTKYVGAFKDGLYNGQGTKSFGKGSGFEGDRYVGEWKDNKKHGQGTYTIADGTVYKGLWKNDEFIGE